VLHPEIMSTGWVPGAGTDARDGDNALVWSVSAPPDEASSTLALAIADEEYWSLTVTPAEGYRLNLRGAELRFTIRRIDWHAPRRYAVFSSIGGFGESEALLVSGRTQETRDIEYVVTLPDDPDYEGLTGPVEFRVYGFAAQYGGHRTSLIGFRLNGSLDGTASVGATFKAF
jgi:hypothetical protein